MRPNDGSHVRSVPGKLAARHLGSWCRYGRVGVGDAMSEGGVAALGAVVGDGPFDGLALADKHDAVAGAGDGGVEVPPLSWTA